MNLHYSYKELEFLIIHSISNINFKKYNSLYCLQEDVFLAHIINLKTNLPIILNSEQINPKTLLLFITDNNTLESQNHRFTLFSKNKKNKSNIIGVPIKSNDTIILPQNIKNHTPTGELGNLVGEKISNYCFGFSSEECKTAYISLYGLPKHEFDIVIYETKINTDMLFDEIKITYTDEILTKINFIKEYCITHFIEEDWQIAMLISEQCPLTKVYFISGRSIYQIQAQEGHPIL